MIKDLVSVIIPVYNGENYVTNILNSLRNQTYQNLEIFIVNDGSTDNTLQILHDYKKYFNNIKIINAKHSSASGAINKALPLINGEFLIWPDADDVLEENSIEERVNFLKEHKNYQIVRSTSYYFDDKGKVNFRDENIGDLNKENIFLDILFNKTFICCGCYMIRTKMFFKIYKDKQIFESPVGQNFQMLLPMLYKYKCHTINKELYGVYVRDNSHSRTKLTEKEEIKKYEEFERLIDEIIKITRIVDKEILRQINNWKNNRRYFLYKKYGYKQEALDCIKTLRKEKFISLAESAKRYLRIKIRNTNIEKTIYQILRRNEPIEAI